MKKSSFFARLSILAIFFFLLVSIAQMRVKLIKLRETEAELTLQAASINLSIEELNDKLTWPFNEETIKRFAREKLNLRDPGDILYASDLPN
ncbi:MAG: hypothetical protein VB118_11825 [Oscillospiraceae bacterium]|nr:hypothetical protein [Oscillospiraceae bacterium]